MRLASMTGYARTFGQVHAANWVWEVKTVNAKGFNLRLRLPPGLDGLEAQIRARVAGRVKRGTVHASLALQRARPEQRLRIDRDKLAALLEAVAGIALPPNVAPATLDGLLGLPGVVDVTEGDGQVDEDLNHHLLAGLDETLDALAAMRSGEGQALGEILDERLSAIVRLTAAAEAAPGRTAERIRGRIARRIAELSEAVPALDETRLHQEALLMAAKADIREELDRLVMHRAAASSLLAEGGAIGRRLDFLAQELGREASTLCAKSNDAGLTTIGLELRTEIEQFREQVQNLE